MDFQTFAILPAGGCGQRTGVDIPKQYCNVLGRPLIVYALECFQRITWIEKVLVAIAPDWKHYVEELIHCYKLTKVELLYGGTSRHRTIQNSVQHLRDSVLKRKDGEHPGAENGRIPGEEMVVIVHDAVRPFADEDILQRVALAAKEHGAAGSVLSLVSTTVESDSNDVLVQSLVRSKFKESHTPQAFTWPVLEIAYRKISEHELDHGTEVLDLALKYAGCRAKLVEAPDYVWKVTYKKDFIAAESFAKVHNSEVFFITSEPVMNRVFTSLCDCLTSRSLKVSTVSSLPDAFNLVYVTVVLHLVKPASQEAAMMCEQSMDALVSRSGHGGLLACICHLSDDDDQTLGFYRRLVMRLAAQGKAERVCALLVAYTTTQVKEPQTIRRVCEMSASLIFNRDPLMSGQLFVVSEQD